MRCIDQDGRRRASIVCEFSPANSALEHKPTSADDTAGIVHIMLCRRVYLRFVLNAQTLHTTLLHQPKPNILQIILQAPVCMFVRARAHALNA